MNFIKNCEKCNNLLALTSITKEGDDFNACLLPGSRHLAFFNRQGYHLKCLDDIAEKKIAEKAKTIPENSLTDFSKLIKKKEILLTCSICLESDDIWLFMMPCTHILCYHCFDKWEKQSNKCPTCNTENYGLKNSFDISNLMPILYKQSTVEPPEKKKSKIENVLDGFLTIQQPKMERQSSTPYTQTSLSTPCENPHTYNSFDVLKMKVMSKDDKIDIKPVSTSRKLDDFSDLIEGNGPLFISATTEKSTNLGYNDLVCKVYTLDDTLGVKQGDIQSEEKYKYSGFLNYAYMNSEGIKHSGDNLEKRFENTILQHGIYIPNEENQKIKIHFVNENIEGNEITSIYDNKFMQKAFDNTLLKYSNGFNEEKPKKIIICAQVTFNEKLRLKDLSKNLNPSCGFILNKSVYSCDWTDDTNMTIWAFILLF